MSDVSVEVAQGGLEAFARRETTHSPVPWQVVRGFITRALADETCLDELLIILVAKHGEAVVYSALEKLSMDEARKIFAGTLASITEAAAEAGELDKRALDLSDPVLDRAAEIDRARRGEVQT